MYSFQVYVNLNVLKHYYQKTAIFSPRFSIYLKSKHFDISSQLTPALFIFQISVPWMVKEENIQTYKNVSSSTIPK